jgi:hypothetical protein
MLPVDGPFQRARRSHQRTGHPCPTVLAFSRKRRDVSSALLHARPQPMRGNGRPAPTAAQRWPLRHCSTAARQHDSSPCRWSLEFSWQQSGSGSGSRVREQQQQQQHHKHASPWCDGAPLWPPARTPTPASSPGRCETVTADAIGGLALQQAAGNCPATPPVIHLCALHLAAREQPQPPALARPLRGLCAPAWDPAEAPRFASKKACDGWSAWLCTAPRSQLACRPMCLARGSGGGVMCLSHQVPEPASLRLGSPPRSLWTRCPFVSPIERAPNALPLPLPLPPCSPRHA